MSTLIMSSSGEIQLPNALRGRYGFVPGQPIRIVETTTGVLLVPLGPIEADPELAAELRHWQNLAAESLKTFPYES